MPLPREQHAILNANGGKNAPSIHQAHLPGRDHAVPRVANFVVVKQEAVHGFILVPKNITQTRKLAMEIQPVPDYGRLSFLHENEGSNSFVYVFPKSIFAPRTASSEVLMTFHTASIASGVNFPSTDSIACAVRRTSTSVAASSVLNDAGIFSRISSGVCDRIQVSVLVMAPARSFAVSRFFSTQSAFEYSTADG